MNYLQWNNAIIDHYFNPEKEDKEVILYFSEDVIQEIGENNFALPEDGYLEDFFRALRNGVHGTHKLNFIERIINLDKRYIKNLRIDGVSCNYPPYLSYILSFLLPFTSGALNEGFGETNFHDNVKNYFESNKLTINYDNQIRYQLKEIDYLWNDIYNWLHEKQNLSLGYIEKIENPVPNRKYVSKFEYHIIFRKEQEDKLSLLFDSNNILPNEPIEVEVIRKLLINNQRDLRLSDDIISKIKNNEYIGDKIVKRAFKYYNLWDGTNRHDYTKSSNKNNIKRGYSRKRIILCLDFNNIEKIINMKYIRLFSADGLPEVFSLTNIEGTEFEDIQEDSKNPLYSAGIVNCFKNLNQNIELEDKSNRIKYSWKPKNFYLFKRDSQLMDWVEIQKIEFNTDLTLIIAEKEFFKNNLKDWYESNNIPTTDKCLYNNNTNNKLPEEWLAFTIKQITKYQHPNLVELKTTPEDKPKINFDRVFFFDACFYSDILPNVWVDNCEIESDDIVAVYEDNTVIHLEREGIYFHFTKEHLQRKNQEFKLKYRDIEYPRFVKIIEFKQRKANDEIEQFQPIRNLIGNSIKPNENKTNYFQGIEHHFNNELNTEIKITQRNTATRECILINTKDGNFTQSKDDYNTTHLGNILINYISTKGKISKTEYDKAVIYLMRKLEDKGITKRKILNSLYDLQNFGYVDYDAEHGKIIINKTSLIVKPSESGTILLLLGARDNNLIQEIIKYSNTGNYYIDIFNNTSSLLPQTILIKFANCNHNVVNDISTHFNLIFKKEEQIFTQWAFANAYNLNAWTKYAEKTTELNLVSDLEGGKIFDIENLAFQEKPINFNKELSFTWFSNVNGNKNIYRLWFNNEAYHIAERSYGIYLFLYLYEKMNKEKLEKEKNQGNIDNHEFKNKKSYLEQKTNILLYDKTRNSLFVPLTCPLPKYNAIAYTLMSGEKAEIEKYNDREYLVYKNIPFLFCQIPLHLNMKQTLQVSKMQK